MTEHKEHHPKKHTQGKITTVGQMFDQTDTFELMATPFGKNVRMEIENATDFSEKKA
jgi:hypothetical protein